ncbi:MAG TPA: ABC transporter ATP-binding protein [Thermoanaerobaculia bacterium]|nr:ABC transporter ATP-binding protein [Thermoanaerobaculia bacterium]
MPPLLEVEDLSIAFPGAQGEVSVVRGVSLAIDRGEVLGLVGESGAGKTLTALAMLRLVPPPGRITGGSVRLAGEELLSLPEPAMRRVRGRRIAMVFQDPAAALDPVRSVGAQLSETIRAHRRVSRAAARDEAAALLARVALAEPAEYLGAFAHQLSGGESQRVLLALALAGGPEVLLADEPTAALDVTVQAQVLDLLQSVRRRRGLAMLLVTHDLGVVAAACDRVAVLYGGEVVEQGSTRAVLAAPRHPYTRALLAAVPRLGRPAPRGRLPTVPGHPATAADRPSGCAFHPRCPEVMAVCRAFRPPLFPVGDGVARCFLWGEPQEAERRS